MAGPSHSVLIKGGCLHYRGGHMKRLQLKWSPLYTPHRFPLLDLLAIGSDTGLLFQLMLYSSSLAPRSILHSSNNHLLGNVRRDASGSVFIDGMYFFLIYQPKHSYQDLISNVIHQPRDFLYLQFPKFSMIIFRALYYHNIPVLAIDVSVRRNN